YPAIAVSPGAIYESSAIAGKASAIPQAHLRDVRSRNNNAERTIVSIGYIATTGNTMNAGPLRKASNRSNCPPAPVAPTMLPQSTDLPSRSNLPAAKRTAIRAHGTIVRAHTL